MKFMKKLATPNSNLREGYMSAKCLPFVAIFVAISMCLTSVSFSEENRPRNQLLGKKLDMIAQSMFIGTVIEDGDFYLIDLQPCESGPMLQVSKDLVRKVDTEKTSTCSDDTEHKLSILYVENGSPIFLMEPMLVDDFVKEEINLEAIQRKHFRADLCATWRPFSTTEYPTVEVVRGANSNTNIVIFSDAPHYPSPTGAWQCARGHAYACGSLPGGKTMYCCDKWEPATTIGPTVLGN